MQELNVMDIKNFNSMVGQTFYITCPNDERYFRTVYVRYNIFTQTLQPMVSNEIYGSPPPGMKPMSPMQLSRLKRTQIQSSFY